MKSKLADRVFIRGLLVPALIGVLPEERKAPQNLIIDLEIFVDLRAAAENDDLKKTIDYAAVRRLMIEFISQFSCDLLETLADRLTSHLRQHFNFNALRLSITKRPFDMPDVEGVGVAIERDFANE